MTTLISAETRQQTLAAYHACEMTVAEVEHWSGVDRSSIYRWLRKDELPHRSAMPGYDPGKPGRRVDPTELRELHGTGLSDYRLAAALGVSRRQVRKLRAQLGLPANFNRGWPRATAALLLLLAGPAWGHDWYSGLTSPSSGKGCCDTTDCRPAPPCTLANGKQGLMVRNACRPIPWHNVLQMPSPDGESHACMMPTDLEPRCVILGGQA